MRACTEDGRLVLISSSTGADGGRTAFTVVIARVDSPSALLCTDCTFGASRKRASDAHVVFAYAQGQLMVACASANRPIPHVHRFTRT